MILESARRALGEKLPIERWAFWVFNHDSRPGADNLIQCELLQNSMRAAQIYTADNISYDFAKLLVENITSKTGLGYSTNRINRIDNGVYTRNYTFGADGCPEVIPSGAKVTVTLTASKAGCTTPQSKTVDIQ